MNQKAIGERNDATRKRRAAAAEKKNKTNKTE
jgi:hypothetical protein